MRNEVPDEPPGWSSWVREHAPRWLLFARQQTRCEADAQDVVQEALATAWRRTPEGTLPATSLVYATVRRRALDLARRNDRRTLRESCAHLTTSPAHFDTAAEDAEREQLLQRALAQITPAFREVVTLKVWGELTFGEIADALGIPANTAASRYRYGLEELRALTKEHQHER